MGRPGSSQKGKYKRLGQLFRQARGDRSVEVVATQLGVSESSIYQVEQGNKKPGEGKKRPRNRTPAKTPNIEQWAEVYGISLTSDELWEALREAGEAQFPLYFQILKKPEEPEKEAGVSVDALAQVLAQLGAEERVEALLFIDFLHWKRQQAVPHDIQERAP